MVTSGQVQAVSRSQRARRIPLRSAAWLERQGRNFCGESCHGRPQWSTREMILGAQETEVDPKCAIIDSNVKRRKIVLICNSRYTCCAPTAYPSMIGSF